MLATGACDIVSCAAAAIPMSEDHKPNRADERQRIESAGGIVVWAGTWRVGGVLAGARLFPTQQHFVMITLHASCRPSCRKVLHPGCPATCNSDTPGTAVTTVYAFECVSLRGQLLAEACTNSGPYADSVL